MLEREFGGHYDPKLSVAENVRNLVVSREEAMQYVTRLQDAVSHLRKGIEAYREAGSHGYACGWSECPACAWEQEDRNR